MQHLSFSGDKGLLFCFVCSLFKQTTAPYWCGDLFPFTQTQNIHAVRVGCQLSSLRWVQVQLFSQPWCVTALTDNSNLHIYTAHMCYGLTEEKKKSHNNLIK